METTDKTQLTKRQEYWLSHLQACNSAGLTITAYAKDKQINVKSLYSAKESLIKKGILPRAQRPSRFQRAKVIDISRDYTFRIQLPNGVCVTAPGSVDSVSLSMILKTAAKID
jgi:hypothetical protein